MKFIIQENFPTKQYFSKYIEAFQFNNAEYIIGEPESINGGEEYYVIGSIEFVRSINARYDTIPIENTFDYNLYSIGNEDLLLNNEYLMATWSYLKTDNCINLIKRSFSDSSKIFIRPNSGNKIFDGTTLTTKYWDMELGIIEDIASINNRGSKIPNTCNVIISDYKDIIAEYRAFIINSKIIDISEYINNTEFTIDKAELKKVCSNLLSKFKRDKNSQPYTMDFCIIPGDEFKILEINSGQSAGWYDMDYSKIIKGIIKWLQR